jgi:hypothetical protein
MGKLILKTTIKREPQMLYYCGTSKDGFITINSAVMHRSGRKKGSSSKRKAPVKKVKGRK